MKIDKIPISEIIPYKNNPRKNDKAIDIVAKSIARFGFLNPIILDKNNEIAAGHTRIKSIPKAKEILQEMILKEQKKNNLEEAGILQDRLSGLNELPVIWADDLTDSQIKAYRIADNKTSELAEWDNDLLKNEFYALEGTDSFDFTGFSSDEISKIWDKPIKEDDFEIPKEPKYKVSEGDIYKLGDHRLMCGDSIKREDVDALMDKNKAVLMVTDPPYGVNYDPKWRDEADKKGILGNKYPTRSLGMVKNDDKIDWSDAYTLFNGDVVYIYHAGKYSGEVAESIIRVGFEIINQIIWVKPHFALSRGDYHWRHEPLWYAVRKGKNHNWQGSRTEDTVWEIAGMNAMGSSQDKADETTGHGTQKPIECMKRPIINSSKKGDGVYDPFGGSGSTLIACEQLNRKCFMMELDPVYCSVIIERWEKLTGKQAVKL